MKTSIKSLLVTLVATFSYSTVFACDAAYVKYRDTPVCLDQFEHLNTSKSNFVKGAWYDASNDYMVISLKGAKYHYCGVPDDVWGYFQSAPSYGRFYIAYFRGGYDCRRGGVPGY